MKNEHLEAAIKKALAEQYPAAQMTEHHKEFRRAQVLSEGEEGLWWQLSKLSKLPLPEREAKLVSGRDWRVDFCWRAPKKLVVEIEGGIWTGGRHVRPKGFREDMKKYNAIEKLGFRVMRFPPDAVKRGEVLGFLEEFFGTKAA